MFQRKSFSCMKDWEFSVSLINVNGAAIKASTSYMLTTIETFLEEALITFLTAIWIWSIVKRNTIALLTICYVPDDCQIWNETVSTGRLIYSLCNNLKSFDEEFYYIFVNIVCFVTKVVLISYQVYDTGTSFLCLKIYYVHERWN